MNIYLFCKSQTQTQTQTRLNTRLCASGRTMAPHNNLGVGGGDVVATATDDGGGGGDGVSVAQYV